jgi:hypothetical protein
MIRLNVIKNMCFALIGLSAGVNLESGTLRILLVKQTISL